MANRTLKFQHIIHGTGGTGDDSYVNTFYAFGDIDLEATDAAGGSKGDKLCDFIGAFYDGNNTSPGAGNAISEYYSARCAGFREVKIYEVGLPLGSGPVHTKSMPAMLHIPDRQSLPEEVALCLSYRAVDSGFNRARRRGRIYLGPFNDAAVDDIAAHDAPVRPAGALMTVMQNAAVHLAGALTSRGLSWRMWSATGNQGFDIIEVSVDDAFDTVRGRGTAPSGRDVTTV